MLTHPRVLKFGSVTASSKIIDPTPVLFHFLADPVCVNSPRTAQVSKIQRNNVMVSALVAEEINSTEQRSMPPY